ncbi:MAG TPA: hypothetical protein VND90_05540 [Terracidiphilus sp.]|nr:hypothetical protein [Terracidiphilus sp.]
MRFEKLIRVTGVGTAAVILLGMSGPRADAQMGAKTVSTASALSIPASARIEPAALQAILLPGGAKKPLVLQVGSHVLFEEAHIPGALYAGPGSEARGLERLQKAVAGMPKGKWVVIYCGCCPWTHCPNMGPAFAKLRSLGFTHVQALYIAHNFGRDWVNQGYRVESGK